MTVNYMKKKMLTTTYNNILMDTHTENSDLEEKKFYKRKIKRWIWKDSESKCGLILKA